MSANPLRPVLFFDTTGYMETLQVKTAARTGPMGLMGRQVAGKEFLTAFLAHSRLSDVGVLVRDRANAEAWRQLCEQHRSLRSRPRRWHMMFADQFLATFGPEAPASPLYFPCPPEAAHVWARQHAGPGAYAVCGVTHTLSSLPAVQSLIDLLIAPYESFDCLICTSRAVVRMVRQVTTAFADNLRERYGARPVLRPRLELVPLGVDPNRFHPATPEQRAAQRRALGIADDEVAVLFVGRLSFHAKAHPFPMYDGLAEAARQTGKKVHLLMSGWAANDHIQRAFADGARVLAPNLRVQFVDGTAPDRRYAVWQAADVFTSPSDNIQETFGLVIVEAMACGLPVVAPDWDGYRDLIVDGETGLLVPTYMVEGATHETTTRLLLGEVNYDNFLAACSQATIVDPAASAAAYARLLADADLRQGLGSAGRKRALERFTWEQVVHAYEAIWQGQEEERRAFRAGRSVAPGCGPACYPPPEVSFAGYPTRWLSAGARLAAGPDAGGRLVVMMSLAVTSYSPRTRCGDVALLGRILQTAAAGCTVAQLDDAFRQAGVASGLGRATIAWMLKYGLLQLQASAGGAFEPAPSDPAAS